MPNFAEIVVILVVIALVFGFGKITSVGSQLGRMRKEFLRGLEGSPDGAAGHREVIDITPETAPTSSSPKPGTRPQPVEDAELE